MKKIVLGPPGTGKTTHLIGIVDDFLSAGLQHDRVGYFAFTRKAANEARERMMSKFGLGARDLPWCRTIHSLAHNRTGMSRGSMLGKDALKHLGQKMGVEFTGMSSEELAYSTQAPTGDKLLFLENAARVRMRSLRTEWEASDHGIGWLELDQFSRSYVKFKRDEGLKDHTDVLDDFVNIGIPPQLDLVVVDEGQDLSRLAWVAMEKTCAGASKVVVAGDDDQAIFSWAGADSERFLELDGEVEVLEQSYRIPRVFHELSGRLVGRLSRRRPKRFDPRSEEGSVESCYSLDGIDMDRGSWLLLARHGYQLGRMEAHCQRAGIPYLLRGKPARYAEWLDRVLTWESLRKDQRVCVDRIIDLATCTNQVGPSFADLKNLHKDTLMDQHELRERGMLDVHAPWYSAMDKMPQAVVMFFRSARRRGEKLKETPRVNICTIHEAKGGEADSVVLSTEISDTTRRAWTRDPDPETRVWYVGATRCRERLVVLNEGKSSFDM